MHKTCSKCVGADGERGIKRDREINSERQNEREREGERERERERDIEKERESGSAHMERMGATMSKEAMRMPSSAMTPVRSSAHVGSPLAFP